MASLLQHRFPMSLGKCLVNAIAAIVLCLMPEIGISQTTRGTFVLPEVNFHELEKLVDSLRFEISHVPAQTQIENKSTIQDIAIGVSQKIFGRSIFKISLRKDVNFAYSVTQNREILIQEGALEELAKEVKDRESALVIMEFVLAHEISHWILDNYYLKVLSTLKSQSLRSRILQLEDNAPHKKPDFSKLNPKEAEQVYRTYITNNLAYSLAQHSLVDLLAAVIIKKMGRDANLFPFVLETTQIVALRIAPNMPAQVPLIDPEDELEFRVQSLRLNLESTP